MHALPPRSRPCTRARWHGLAVRGRDWARNGHTNTTRSGAAGPERLLLPKAHVLASARAKQAPPLGYGRCTGCRAHHSPWRRTSYAAHVALQAIAGRLSFVVGVCDLPRRGVARVARDKRARTTSCCPQREAVQGSERCTRLAIGVWDRTCREGKYQSASCLTGLTRTTLHDNLLTYTFHLERKPW